MTSVQFKHAVTIEVPSVAMGLFLLLLVLKLCGVVHWSWWLVTLPLWASAMVLVAAVVAFVIVMLCIWVYER